MRIERYLPRLHRDLQEIARVARPREACGIIKAGGEWIELRNIADDPTEHFDIGSLAELEANHGAPAAIWHTHPGDEPPSEADVGGCAATALPWIIAGPTKIWCIHPAKPPYVAREFLYGVEDCWQVVSDWFAGERGLFLPWFARPAEGWWKEAGPSPYLEAAGAYGFSVRPVNRADLANITVGDVLLMRIAGRQVNHAAVYVGGGAILHHLYDQLSTIEQLDERFQDASEFIGRHKSLP